MAKSKRPTMRDVATAAGVSLKSVSRVVNDEQGVSPPLAGRVLAAIDELAYQPDHRARQLRQKIPDTATIGCLISDVANPFFGSLLRGIEDVASARGCLVMSASTAGSTTTMRALIQSFVRRRLDGLIIVPVGPIDGSLAAEISQGHPVVFADLEPPETHTVDIARTDHHAGAVRAVRHLASFGHTRIAYLGDDLSVFSASERLRGFRNVMSELNLVVDPELVMTATSSPEEWTGLSASILTLDEPPTAVFSAQNIVTTGVVRALHLHGLENHIAQVGFDDLALANVVSPALTVVSQQPQTLGNMAAETLFRRIDGDDGPVQRHLVDPPLILRGSGEIRPR